MLFLSDLLYSFTESSCFESLKWL